MSNVRKTLADFAASIITAYESDLEDAERCFGEAETRAVTAEKELAAAQERLARRPHELGDLVRNVEVEARLVKELDEVRNAFEQTRKNLNEALAGRLPFAESYAKKQAERAEEAEAEVKRLRDCAIGKCPACDGKPMFCMKCFRGCEESREAVEAALKDERAAHNATLVKLREAQAEIERLKKLVPVCLPTTERLQGPRPLPPTIPGIPCQPPEDVARGVLDIERAEARDATGRAP